jgi:hypothetical protein
MASAGAADAVRRPVGRSDQPIRLRVTGKSGATVYTDLLVNIVQMHFDRSFADEEPLGDFTVA